MIFVTVCDLIVNVEKIHEYLSGSTNVTKVGYWKVIIS